MEDGVKLSDGTVLPKTTGVAVSSANMWDPVRHHLLLTVYTDQIANFLNTGDLSKARNL